MQFSVARGQEVFLVVGFLKELHYFMSINNFLLLASKDNERNNLSSGIRDKPAASVSKSGSCFFACRRPNSPWSGYGVYIFLSLNHRG